MHRIGDLWGRGSAWIDSPRDSMRVTRSGAYDGYVSDLRVANRTAVNFWVTSSVIGFRCAR